MLTTVTGNYWSFVDWLMWYTQLTYLQQYSSSWWIRTPVVTVYPVGAQDIYTVTDSGFCIGLKPPLKNAHAASKGGGSEGYWVLISWCTASGKLKIPSKFLKPFFLVLAFKNGNPLKIFRSALHQKGRSVRAIGMLEHSKYHVNHICNVNCY